MTMESSPERIPSKNEVLIFISRFVENPTVTRELSDSKGLYLLEVQTKGTEQGEIVEYQYMRKGRFGMNQARETGICVTSYKNSTPEHSDMIAVYNSERGEWIDVS